MEIIDTHCHLDLAEFDDDLEAVLERAQGAGVHRMITVGSSLGGSRSCVDLASQYDTVWASVGLHPHDIEDVVKGLEGRERDLKWKEVFEQIVELVSKDRVVAIGECGLDVSRKGYDLSFQERTFRDQMDLAKEYDLPVILHIRDAYDEAAAVLRDYPDVSTVTHCYTGTLGCAKRYIEELGSFMSFTGIVTFGDAKIGELADVVRWVPKDRYFVETDAPYLAPTPYRGKRNEPGFVVEVARTIARLRGESLDVVAEQSTKNAMSFYSSM